MRPSPLIIALSLLLAACALLPGAALGQSESAGAMPEEPDPSTLWAAWAGRTSLRFDRGLLQAYDLTLQVVDSGGEGDVPGSNLFRILPLGTLDFWAPKAAFEGFRSGSLVHEGGVEFRSPYGAVTLANFSVRPTFVGQLTLELVNANGKVVFVGDHIHHRLFPEEERLTLWHMDLHLTREAALAIGYPELENAVLGQAFIDARLTIPPGAGAKDGLFCTTPNWDNGNEFTTDVQLTAIGDVGQRAPISNDRVVIAPSATLKNVGTADVPWYPKFGTTTGTVDDYPAPYQRDQHPVLVWAMYHLEDTGVFRQLAISAAKHAFATANTACNNCPAGNILWAPQNTNNQQGCEDAYGQATNDQPVHLAPRAGFPSFTGEWEQCGSFFAPDQVPPGPCPQTNNGATADEYERRMVVDQNELESGNPNYWVEAWYLVRDDINIFNTMGYRPTTPTQSPGSGNWGFPLEPFVNGGAIDTWIAPGTGNSTESHQRIDTGAGHYSIAARAIDLGGDSLRMVYVVMNYDYDAQFRSFSIPIDGNQASSIQAFAGDGRIWTPAASSSELRWDAPGGEGLDWGTMITFTFEIDGAPQPGVVTLESLETATALTPTLITVLDLNEIVFRNSFE